jgi:hypothetical protein
VRWWGGGGREAICPRESKNAFHPGRPTTQPAKTSRQERPSSPCSAGCANYGAVLQTDVLHCFPLFECRLHRQKISMFVIIRVPLDRSACPREATTADWSSCIFRKNLRQGFRELAAKCRKVGIGHDRASDLGRPHSWSPHVKLLSRPRSFTVHGSGRERADEGPLTKSNKNTVRPLDFPNGACLGLGVEPFGGRALLRMREHHV